MTGPGSSPHIFQGFFFVERKKLKIVRRYDQGEIRSAIRTEEGFLKVDAVVTRTGVFTYRNADGSLRRELRHPDDVFRLDSLRTLKMLPITNEHPDSVFVTSENAKELSVGYTGEDVRPDGAFIISPLKVTDSAAINAVENGKQGLSLGYELVLVAEDGEYKGERYDFRQTKIRYNHLAIVANPRAGDEARIHLDENDAVQEIGEKKKNTDNQRSRTMVKINLDGLEYEAAPEVAKAFEKAKKNLDEANGNVKSLTEANTKLQANLDAAKEELKKLKNVDSAAEIQKGVKERLELVSKASKHLDEDTQKKLDGMSDQEIKLSVIKAHYPEANLDGKDSVYIDARFDGAIELSTEKNPDPMAQQRKDAANADKNQNDELNQDKARERMQKRNLDAWNPEKK